MVLVNTVHRAQLGTGMLLRSFSTSRSWTYGHDRSLIVRASLMASAILCTERSSVLAFHARFYALLRDIITQSIISLFYMLQLTARRGDEMKLISFSVGNYKSFKEPVQLSMVAGRIKEHQESNTFGTGNNLRLLKSAVIYGPNASGKSNLLDALDFLLTFVRFSAKESQVGEGILVVPFKLSTTTEDKPSFFEIEFLDDESSKIFRYGFEASPKNIDKEWLFYWNHLQPGNREKYIFKRSGQDFNVARQFKSEIMPRIKNPDDKSSYVRDNALALSVLANSNSPMAVRILRCMSEITVVRRAEASFSHFTDDYIERSSKNKQKIEELLKVADLGIDRINTMKIESPRAKESPLALLGEVLLQASGITPARKTNIFRQRREVITFHKKYDPTGQVIGEEEFDLHDDESDGTKHFYSLAGSIVDCLEQGKVLVVDELDLSLHTLLTRHIINLFNSSSQNSRNSQLIAAIQDTNLLSRHLLRRDQIWLIEKDKYGASELLSLLEYRVRKDASYEKDYITGRYGAIPILRDYSPVVHEEKSSYAHEETAEQKKKREHKSKKTDNPDSL